MRAIILAGGRGTRLKPYTNLIPKPLVPIGEKYSVVEIVIKQLASHGFKHITLAVNHLSKLIMAYFGDGSDFGIQIDYSVEAKELSTIGPLTLIKDLPDDFLVMNGDILSNLNYKNFLENHILEKSCISVSSFQREIKTEFGVLECDASGYLTDFKEKPSISMDVSMGVYCLNRSVVNELEPNQPYGFDKLMIESIQKKKRVAIKKFDGFWLDIGREQDYEYANENYKKIFEDLELPE